jgi:hypothetical protein
MRVAAVSTCIMKSTAMPSSRRAMSASKIASQDGFLAKLSSVKK